MGLASESGEKLHGDGHSNNGSTKDTNLNSSDASKALKKESFEGDFIIVSEFSEQVGPVDLYIIPEGAAGSFNVSSFVLKIMAVDFQNKSNDPQSYLKDSQVAMPEPGENAYTYLHHFNLLDVYARGYVRPMCISYITHDREKIMDNFHEFMTKVSKITRKGNHRLFLRDLQERMADVRYTQTVLNSNTQELENTAPTPTTVNEYLADLEALHLKFHKAVTLKQIKKANSKAARNRLHHGAIHLSPPQSTNSGASLHADYDEDDDEDEEEAEEENKEGKEEREETENEKQKIVKSINKAVAELISRDYQPQVLQSLHPKTLHGKSLRDLHGLCDGNANKSLSLLRSLHRHYSRPSTVLSLEAFDSPSLLPSSSLLTIGQAVVLNFNLDVDKHMSKVMSHELERAASTTMFNNSSAINTASKDTSSSMDDDSSSYGSPYSMGSMASSPAQDDEAFANELAKLANGLSAAGAPDSDAHFLVHSDEVVLGDAVTNDEKSVGTPKLSRPSPHAQFFCAYLWPNSGNAPQTQSTVNLQRSPSGNLQNSSNLTPPSTVTQGANLQGVPGKGLLELRGKVVWLRHVVYSILRGRPVVVLGSVQNESTVRGIIQALSIFVAGNNAGIAPWRTKPLKMSDLASFKLTGMVRSCTIPKAVEKYVTIFDLETDTLKAPPYPASGKFIDEIFSIRRFWPDELSYLAHVHYVLFDIGVKSCLYYHLCCVTVHQLTPQQASQAHSYIHPHPHHSPSPPPHPSLPSSHSYSHYPHSHHSHNYSSHYYRSYSPRYPYPPSPHPHSSQPPSPYPYTVSASSQPPSPHQISQPPSPRHNSSQPPSPRRLVNNNNNTTTTTTAAAATNPSSTTIPVSLSTFSTTSSIPSPYSIPPSFVTAAQQAQQQLQQQQQQQLQQQQQQHHQIQNQMQQPSPQNVFVPVHSPVMATGEPRKEIRPEPIRLESTEGQTAIPPKTETDSPKQQATDQPKTETEPPKLPRTESRPKGALGSLQAPVRSHSMPSIADKFRPNINNAINNANNANTTNNTNNNNNNNNANNSSGNITTANNVNNTSNIHHTSPQSSLTYPPHYTNMTNININGSGNIPHSHHSYKGDEWRNSSSPSVSRHSSWQYGKSLHSQGHRSLSDSQINPFWLPQNPATREQIKVQFFRSMDIPQGDTDIVMYLAEVVKEQQAHEVQGTETPVIRLDYSTCQVFHSKEKKGVNLKEK